MFAWWGQFVYRHRWAVLGVSAVMLAGSIVALFNGGTLKNSGGRNTESGRALALMQDQLPQNGAGSSFVLVFGSDAMAVGDPAFKQAMLTALQPLKADPRVKTVDTPFDLPAEQARAMTSTDGHHAFAQVSLKDDYPTARQYYAQLRAEVRSDRLHVLGTGNVAIGSDFDKYLASDLASMGFAGAIVVAIAVLYALTFLASLLAILGHRVNWARLPLPRGATGRGLWHGLAIRVMRHPVLVLVPVVALLLLMVLPFFQIRIANGDVGMLPPNAETRRGYDQLQTFPGQGQTFFSVVVHYASGGPLTRDRVGELYDLAQRIKQVPGVAGVESLVSYDGSLTRAEYQTLLTQPASAQPARVQAIVHGTTGSRIAVLSVVTKHGQESDAARSVVRSLRSMPPPAGSSMLVAAFSIAFTDFILARIPLAVAYVMVVTYLVLFLLTGSVVLPLKAVIMNILSIGASFGALVWIFQQGHLSSLLNFTSA